MVRFSTGLRNALQKALIARPAAAILPAFYINIYTGAQPANADAAATGTLLAKLTVSGDGTTALAWEADTDVASGIIEKLASQTWQDSSCDATGTAGWFRLYNSVTNTPSTLSTTDLRIDGSITVTDGGGDMELSTTSLVSAAPFSLTSFQLELPE